MSVTGCTPGEDHQEVASLHKPLLEYNTLNPPPDGPPIVITGAVLIDGTENEPGVPLVAHLELVDADVAIRSGVKGIEHVTSFGTAVADLLLIEGDPLQEMSAIYNVHRVMLNGEWLEP